MTTIPIIVAALYKFSRLDDYEAIKPHLLAAMKRYHIKGTLLLAREGINGTVAAHRSDMDRLLAWLGQDERFANLEVKESITTKMPFLRTKVKLKAEIVTMGITNLDPVAHAGTYVDPEDWNELIEDPDVLVVDTRNDYEVAIGSFKNAVNPGTDCFREFPNYVSKNLDSTKHKKVAMFCTGGIRCEKSTAYLKEQGFAEVYHLKGGILKYLEKINQDQSLWQGECFVFDNRVAVTHGVKQGSYDQCYACRYPITPDEMQQKSYVEGVSCPHCIGTKSSVQQDRYLERQKQVRLAQQRGEAHVGRSQTTETTPS